MAQVSRDSRLLDMARDCFNFATEFFDIINTSATHIYHSALELSPLSSIVRRLYYHQRPTPLPRVVAGAKDSWDQSITRFSGYHVYESCAWSACSRFVATRTRKAIEIWDPLTFELLSTLTDPGYQLVGGLAYSPDGRSIACLSNTALIIWDIQTGGVAKRTEYGNTHDSSLLWSLDGNTIGIMTAEDRGTSTHPYTLSTYLVASGTTRPRGGLESIGKPHFWAHNNTFQIMTTAWYDGDLTVKIFEAGTTLTKVESFSIQSRGREIKSFSPFTHRVSISTHGQLVILDVRNSKRLLSETGEFHSHCFSSTGGLFAANPEGVVRVWQYTPNCYTPWREFQYPYTVGSGPSLRFSPAFSPTLGLFGGILQVFRLSDHPTAPPDGHQQLAIISRDGTYVAAANKGQRTIAITNPLSHTPSQFIDACTDIQALVLTGNVVLAVGSETVVAWCLTEEGVVGGVIGDRRADQSDSVWTIPLPLGYASELTFTIEGRIGAIKHNLFTLHVYNTETGEVLQGVRAPHPSGGRSYSLEDVCEGRHFQSCKLGKNLLFPIDYWSYSEMWVKDHEGKHRFWLPFEWRRVQGCEDWFYKITTLQFKLLGNKHIIVMF